MARLIAIHRVPSSPEAYLKHYFDVHLPLAKRLPGLQRYEVSRGEVVDADGKSTAQLIAILHFIDKAAILAALSGPQGQAALEDLPNFSKPENVELFIFDSEEA